MRLDVSDHGLDPADALPAINACLDAARTARGPVTAVIPPGVHHLRPEHAHQRELYVSNTVGASAEHRVKRIALLVEDMADLTVEGHGATLVLHGEQSLFAVIDSARVELTGFATDWVTPRALDLTVLAAGPTHTDLRVPDGYGLEVDGSSLTWTSAPSLDGTPYWTYPDARLPRDPRETSTEQYYLQRTHLGTGRSQRTTWHADGDPLVGGLGSAEWIAPRILRLRFPPRASFPEVGEVFQFRSQARDTPGGLIWHSTDTTLRDLRLGHLHGFGIIAQFTDGVRLSGVRFRAPAGSWRTTAGFADLLQVSGDRGHVVVEDCSFGFAHDDAINVHGTYLDLVDVDGPRATLAFRHPETQGFPQFHPGDQVALVERSTLRDRSRPLDTMVVTVDRPLPGDAAPGRCVVENLTYAPDVTVRRCHFESIPTRGILMTTRGRALIEECTFDRMGMASVYVSADAQHWFESSVVRDLTIRRNSFLRPAPDAPVIWFNPLADDLTAGEVHSGVTIEDNAFVRPRSPLLGATGLAGAAFRGTTVVHSPDEEPPAVVELAHSRVEVGEPTVVARRPPQLRAEFSLDLPPDGGVALVDATAGPLHARFTTEHALEVRFDGEVVAHEDGHVEVPIRPGISVLEAWVRDGPDVERLRWALLALSPRELAASCG